MIKIGDFSKLTQISIRMLRYYDENKILVPKYIDKATNYRFYDVGQIELANRIVTLRDFDFTLKEIKLIIDSPSYSSYLEKQIKIVKEEIVLKKQKIIQMEALLKENDSKMFFPKEKVLPEILVISYRKIMKNYEQEAQLWNHLYDTIFSSGIILPDNAISMAIYHDHEYKEDNVDIEVVTEIKETKTLSSNDVNIYSIPSLKVVSVLFNGSYSNMPKVTSCAMKYLDNNSYELNQPTMNIYYQSPATVDNENDYLTEACFPIKERND